MDQILTAANEKIQSALDHFKKDLASVRAGRANPALIENITVQAYGAPMKLMEVGTITAPQPTLLTVHVWDISVAASVVKALQESSLGLNPAQEGALIRLPIPQLTQERREEFIKVTHQKAEEAKVAIRQIRQDTRQEWDQEEEAGKISEDELKRREKLLQDLVDKKNEEITDLAKVKEAELMQI